MSKLAAEAHLVEGQFLLGEQTFIEQEFDDEQFPEGNDRI
jgi:hypothetical protein